MKPRRITIEVNVNTDKTREEIIEAARLLGDRLQSPDETLHRYSIAITEYIEKKTNESNKRSI